MRAAPVHSNSRRAFRNLTCFQIRRARLELEPSHDEAETRSLAGAAKQATRDIPIVIVAGDPVETGLVPSLARPGGNITGVSLMAFLLRADAVIE